jgi:TIR domain
VAFLTVDAARAAAPQGGLRFAVSEVRKSADTPLGTQFDVFLSHSFGDAQIIAGVKQLLENRGMRVYVDWIEDSQLDRDKVTQATAELLRKRMRNSKSLIFATSETSSKSKWMPWELGFFDGFKPDYAAILPLTSNRYSSFGGQEYLGLYPYVEDIDFTDGTRDLAIMIGDKIARQIHLFPALGAK